MTTAAVHIESHGSGPQLVFLHGWGMHGGVFRPVVDVFSHDYSTVLVDLPGHGYSKLFDGFHDIDKCSDYLVKALQDHLHDKAVVIGWSTGSLIAQNIAIRHSHMVEKLVLITGTPCFKIRDDWQYGIRSSVLDEFQDGLLDNFDRTMKRFLAIQFMHGEEQKENLRLAADLVFARPAPDLEMLNAGLTLLKETDLRSRLAGIECEALILNGERDTLIPTTAARYLGENIKRAKSVIFKSCGHAPFLSHTEKFNECLRQFLI